MSAYTPRRKGDDTTTSSTSPDRTVITNTTASLQRLVSDRLRELENLQEAIAFITTSCGTDASLESTLHTAKNDVKQYGDQCTKMEALLTIRQRELDSKRQEMALTTREANAAEEYVRTLRSEIGALKREATSKGLAIPDTSPEAEKRASLQRSQLLKADGDMVASLVEDAAALAKEVDDLHASVKNIRNQIEADRSEKGRVEETVQSVEGEIDVNSEVLDELRIKLSSFKSRRGIGSSSRTSSITSTPPSSTQPQPQPSIDSVLRDIEALSDRLDRQRMGPK